MSHEKFVFSDEKGQAFDVFKLLIAAVIAVVILITLMQIINIVPKPFSQSPIEQARTLVKSQVTMLGNPLTADVIFKSNDALNSKTIAEATPAVSKEQVCVLPGDYEANESFNQLVSGQAIQYTGTTDISTKILVMCDNGNTMRETLQQYGYKWADQFSSSSCECDTTSASRCCVVVIIK